MASVQRGAGGAECAHAGVLTGGLWRRPLGRDLTEEKDKPASAGRRFRRGERAQWGQAGHWGPSESPAGTEEGRGGWGRVGEGRGGRGRGGEGRGGWGRAGKGGGKGRRAGEGRGQGRAVDHWPTAWHGGLSVSWNASLPELPVLRAGRRRPWTARPRPLCPRMHLLRTRQAKPGDSGSGCRGTGTSVCGIVRSHYRLPERPGPVRGDSGGLGTCGSRGPKASAGLCLR